MNELTNHHEEYSGLFCSYILLCVDKSTHLTMSRHCTGLWRANDNHILSLPLRSPQAGEENKHEYSFGLRWWMQTWYQSRSRAATLTPSPSQARRRVVRDIAWEKPSQLTVSQMERLERNVPGWGKVQREGSSFHKHLLSVCCMCQALRYYRMWQTCWRGAGHVFRWLI